MNIHIQAAEIGRIADALHYDPETGVFTRSNGIVAGGKDKAGYVIIKSGATVVKAHRLAWFVATGAMPKGDIDHINGIKDDNRIANLRDVPRGVNTLNIWKPNANNKSTGLQGVSKMSGRSMRWAARITRDGKRVHLGSFATPQEAHAHYVAVKSDILRELLNAN